MDRRQLSRINRLGQEILTLEARLAGAQHKAQTARERMDEESLTFREWNEAAHEYGVSSGSAFGLERRLQIVRGRFHYEASKV